MSGPACITCGAPIVAGEPYHAKGSLGRERDREHTRCHARREAETATCAAIVAWLRERYPRDGYSGVAELADAIERGEWRK